MEKAEQAAVVLELMHALRSRDSWCGETHVQKCGYLVQEGLRVPSAFEYVLYKYAPYSFDLHRLLGEMRADLLIDREPQPDPYGPTLKPSASGERFRRRHASRIDSHRRAIASVADRFGKMRVSDLERIGTALYVTRGTPGDASTRAARVVQLKRHMGYDEALAATREVDRFLESESSRS